MQLLEEIQKLSISQKAEIFDLLQNDEELNEYIDVSAYASPTSLFAEIKRRDEAYAQGEIKLITSDELTTRINTLINAL